MLITRSACTRTMKELGQCVKALYDTKGNYREPGKTEEPFAGEYSQGMSSDFMGP